MYIYRNFPKKPKIPYFHIKCSKKTFIIHSSNKFEKNTLTIPISHRRISLPTNTHNKPLCDKLTNIGIPIFETTSQTIKNVTNISKRSKNITISHAGIYFFAWKYYDRHYIDKKTKQSRKRIYEHKRQIKLNDVKNVLFSHVLEHTFNFPKPL